MTAETKIRGDREPHSSGKAERLVIGADVGGSHISAAVIDLENKRLLPQTCVTKTVDNQAQAEGILSAWAMALKAAAASIPAGNLAGIGFAMPGPFEYHSGIARFTPAVAKFQNLSGISITSRIKALLKLPDACQLRYLNDAAAFAVGEAWAGRADGTRRSMCITLGTGIGSSFINEGVPVVDGAGVPKTGCVWHLPFKGAIADETFSTRWFVRRYAEACGESAGGVKEIATRAATNPHVKALFVEFGMNLGDFLGPWLKCFGAEMLVVGGNIADAFPLFGDYLRESLSRQRLAVAVEVSMLKETAALLGSARLFEENFWRRVKPLLKGM